MADQKQIQADKAEVAEVPQPTVEDSPSSQQINDKGIQTDVSLNEDKSDQGKAFAAMRKEIADLKSQLAIRQTIGTPPQPQVPFLQTPTIVDINQYIDPNTNEFNAQAYNYAVNNAIVNQSQLVQNQVQSQTDYNLDLAQTQLVFPTLDPTNENYDSQFEEEVAQRYHYLSFIQGKRVSLKQVAREISNKFKKEEAKIDAEQSVVAAEKQLASQETPGHSASSARAAQTQIDEAEEEADLRARTRGLIGDSFTGKRLSDTEQLEATVKRLQKIPWVKPQEAEEQTGT